MKITAYVVDEGRMASLVIPAPSEIPTRAIWIDVVEPTREEMDSLAAQLGFNLELDESGFESELYGHVEVEGEQLTIVMQADRVDGSGDEAYAMSVVVMNADKLITLRSGPLPAIDAAARSAVGMQANADPQVQLMLQILSEAMDIRSRALDAAEVEVHRGARTLFSTTRSKRAEVDLENLLSDLGRLQAQMVSLRYRHGLISRVVEVLRKHPVFSVGDEVREDIELAAGDVTSLSDFAGSVDEQLSRLMDSTIGFIGLRQNASARWFSIVATVFMPPTLLAAVWGMNFEYMPELDERYSYGLAWLLMLLSATIPLWIVRKMGWLSR
ncbi:MAG: hypothetical protein HKN10_05155 [Myxococcales bacterium]|nr:hypothetical protein [Myxococcales bacterium]